MTTPNDTNKPESVETLRREPTQELRKDRDMLDESRANVVFVLMEIETTFPEPWWCAGKPEELAEHIKGRFAGLRAECERLRGTLEAVRMVGVKWEGSCSSSNLVNDIDTCIAGWNRRTVKAEDECERLRGLEKLVKAGRHTFNNLNEHGVCMFDFMNCWLDQARAENGNLKADIVSHSHTIETLRKENAELRHKVPCYEQAHAEDVATVQTASQSNEDLREENAELKAMVTKQAQMLNEHDADSVKIVKQWIEGPREKLLAERDTLREQVRELESKRAFFVEQTNIALARAGKYEVERDARVQDVYALANQVRVLREACEASRKALQQICDLSNVNSATRAMIQMVGTRLNATLAATAPVQPTKATPIEVANVVKEGK